MNDAFSRRYQLVRRIAIGGTAEVFEARLLTGDSPHRPVVIKRVLPQFARDERFRRLFHEEACVAVTIDHPNIVKVIDHGELEQTCYIALELVEGRDLGNLIARARANAAQIPHLLAAFIVTQVGEALAFIHDQTSSEGTPLNIIHRDVSPQNILVSYRGDVKLTDFGIAKSAIRRESTVDGAIRGKLDYMAPEQAALEEVDHRADLFALGCVLFEMVQGTPPFRAESEIQTLQRLRADRPLASPADVAAPEEIREVLKRSLSWDREARYQRAEEMVEALTGYLDQAPRRAVLQTDLAQWIAELNTSQKGAPPAQESALDLAVAQLLGGETTGPASAPLEGTAVFAQATRGESSGHDLTSATPRRGRPSWRIAALIAAIGLGLGGWLILALRTLGPDAAPGAGGDDGGRLGGLDSIGAGSHDAHPDGPSRIWIRSTPPGAALFVDGVHLGSTPFSLRAPGSRFSVELRKVGFRSWRKELEMREASGPIQAALTALPRRRDKARVRPRGNAGITINSLPWSRVYIDGAFVGNTPIVNLKVPAGRRRIELRDQSKRVRKAFSITLKRGKRRAFTFDFSRR